MNAFNSSQNRCALKSDYETNQFLVMWPLLFYQRGEENNITRYEIKFTILGRMVYVLILLLIPCNNILERITPEFVVVVFKSRKSGTDSRNEGPPPAASLFIIIFGIFVRVYRVKEYISGCPVERNQFHLTLLYVGAFSFDVIIL